MTKPRLTRIEIDDCVGDALVRGGISRAEQTVLDQLAAIGFASMLRQRLVREYLGSSGQ